MPNNQPLDAVLVPLSLDKVLNVQQNFEYVEMESKILYLLLELLVKRLKCCSDYFAHHNQDQPFL